MQILERGQIPGDKRIEENICKGREAGDNTGKIMS